MPAPGWSALAAAIWARRGAAAWGLRPLAFLYGLISTAHRAWVVRHARQRQRPAVPLIVIGNVIVGGAGKTPAVIATVQWLRSQGWRPGVISRGYGRRGFHVKPVDRRSTAADSGDEPLLIHLRAGVAVTVGQDRPAAARALLAANPEVDIIVSDDGLQHHALMREVAVIVFDERGAGNGWLLPAGPLREALPGGVPPATVILYNAARPTTALPGSVSARMLSGAIGLSDWWAGVSATASALASLRGRPIIAAAGIARPERFFSMLGEAGLDVVALPLPDHHDFAQLPWPADAADVIVTEKDAVKLRPERLAAEGIATRVWVAPLDFNPEPRYFDELEQALAPHRARAPARHRLW